MDTLTQVMGRTRYQQGKSPKDFQANRGNTRVFKGEGETTIYAVKGVVVSAWKETGVIAICASRR